MLEAMNLPGILTNRRLATLLGLILLLGLSAMAGSSQPDAVVEMTNTLAYTPAEITIQAGETVEWRNASLLMHTVTADPDKATLEESVQLPEEAAPFDSGNLDPGETFRHTFTVSGTYRYFCIPHEGAKMRGEVVVK